MTERRWPLPGKPRPPSADKPNSRDGKVRSWIVMDTISHNRLPRFLLCHDEGEPGARDPTMTVPDYEVTIHSEAVVDPEAYETLTAFKNWVESIMLMNVPNEVEIWQSDHDPRHVGHEKVTYESFYGLELSEWTRPPAEEEEIEEQSRPGLSESRNNLKSKEKNKGNGEGKGKDIYHEPYEGTAEEQIEEKKAIMTAGVTWATKRAHNLHRDDWNVEIDGVKGTLTTRYFVKMPDYCFIGDNLGQEERKPWDAFGECSKDAFKMSMQRVKGAWIDYKCTKHADSQRWRAYLYKPRPIRLYDRTGDSKKRKRHPLTEEETEYEHQAKQRWNDYQRGRRTSSQSTQAPRRQRSLSQQDQPPLSPLRQAPQDAETPHPSKANAIIDISSNTSSSSDGSAAEGDSDEPAPKPPMHERNTPAKTVLKITIQNIPTEALRKSRLDTGYAARVRQPRNRTAQVENAKDQSPATEPEEGSEEDPQREDPEVQSSQEGSGDEEEHPEAEESPSTGSSALSSSLNSEELNELERGAEVWKGPQKSIGLKYKRLQDF